MEKDYLQDTLCSDSLIWNFCVSEKCSISACNILYMYFIDFEEHHKIIKPLGEKYMSFYMKLSSLLSQMLCPVLRMFWPIYTLNPFHCVHTQESNTRFRVIILSIMALEHHRGNKMLYRDQFMDKEETG